MTLRVTAPQDQASHRLVFNFLKINFRYRFRCNFENPFKLNNAIVEELAINSQLNSTPQKTSLNIGTECEARERTRGRIKTSSSRQYRKQERQKRRIAEANELNESLERLKQKARDRSKSTGRSDSQLSDVSSKSSIV